MPVVYLRTDCPQGSSFGDLPPNNDELDPLDGDSLAGSNVESEEPFDEDPLAEGSALIEVDAGLVEPKLNENDGEPFDGDSLAGSNVESEEPFDEDPLAEGSALIGVDAGLVEPKLNENDGEPFDGDSLADGSALIGVDVGLEKPKPNMLVGEDGTETPPLFAFDGELRQQKRGLTSTDSANFF